MLIIPEDWADQLVKSLQDAQDVADRGRPGDYARAFGLVERAMNVFVRAYQEGQFTEATQDH